MTVSPSTIARHAWRTGYRIVENFIEDEALSRGAAIAFYATTALVPVLFIVISIAGSLFGQAAARGALKSDVQQLIGPQVADLLQATIKNAAYTSEGIFASAFSIAMLVVVASGVFSEMRAALNLVWRAPQKPVTLLGLLRMRAESLGLVAALAFLLMTSMVITTLIAAAGNVTSLYLPFGPTVLNALNFCVTWAVTAVLFAAIYRILPDKDLTWHDVAVGGAATALMFQLGQFAVGFYLASSRAVSVYGAAGSLMALLLWIYYSAEIFLLGAEMTKVYMEHRGRL